MTKFIATFYCRNLFTPLETPSHHPYTTTCSLAGSRRGRIISLNILYVAYFPFRCSRKTCDRAYGQRMDNEGKKVPVLYYFYRHRAQYTAGAQGHSGAIRRIAIGLSCSRLSGLG